jgi:hypothetical protein
MTDEITPASVQRLLENSDAELVAAAPQIAAAYLELARRRLFDEFVDQILQILSEAYRNGWTPDTIIEQAREVASWLD